MKPILALSSLILAVCTMGFAQETSGDRIVVPAGNSSRPRVLNCSLLNGSITVKTHGSGDVIVEGEAHSHEEHQGGMRRIGVSTNGLEAVVDDNVISVHNHNGNGNIFITVPVNTSLKLHTLSGGINVDGVNGEVEVHTSNGQVTLNNISGTVTADSQNGAIRVSMDRVDNSKPLAFSTLNGMVDLTFPADLKADLTVKSNHGAVYSDFDVTLGGSRAVTERNGANARYQIRIDSTIRGSINGGGVDLTIHTLNGAVYIRKKK
jgi:Putative adhesin